MGYIPKRRNALNFALGLSLVAVAATLAVQPANAQRTRTAAVSTPVSIDPNINPKPGAHDFVDFRARTAASYGHAFIWYGRVGEKAVEVAGLHPATESVIPYIIGHVLPVPSETGASYGDLDEQYLTASYRVILTEAEAKQVFAYIKHLQATSPLWNAATYNCVAFISNIAQYMGLKVPYSTLLYPENWVNQLRENNGKNPQVRLAARSASMRGD
jgi:hypothetical protein